jgi:hypothetical protein
MSRERRPVSEDSVLWEQDRFAWERQFRNNLATGPGCQYETARKAWHGLGQAGLGDISKCLLWEYAIAERHIAELREGVRRIDDELEALRRAYRVAEERAHDPRRELFVQRLKDAFKTAAQTSWPFRNQIIKTLGDAASKYPPIGNLPVSDAASPKDGDALRRNGAKILLAILRAGANAHGIHLSPNVLVTFAHCANPSQDKELGERVLRRFLKDPPIQAAERDLLCLFELHLPRFLPR